MHRMVHMGDGRVGGEVARRTQVQGRRPSLLAAVGLVLLAAAGSAGLLGATGASSAARAPLAAGAGDPLRRPAHDGGAPPWALAGYPTGPFTAAARGIPDPLRPAAGGLSPRVAAGQVDPHRLIAPGLHAGDPFGQPPDGTPVAAAAGTEPAEMGPVPLLAGWTSSVHRFRVGPALRSYLLVRPRGRSRTALPVLVVLHGRNLTPASMERITGLWDRTGPAIQVYPAGYGRSWDAGGCCGVAYRAGIDDVAFIQATVHRVLAAQPDADPRRVFLAGFSNGGRMAYRMACAAPGTYAAVAAVEAVPVDLCHRTSPVPVLIVANRDDPLLSLGAAGRVRYVYDQAEPSVAATAERVRLLDGCSTAGTRSTTGGLTVTDYGHCSGGGEVEVAEYAFGRHDWSPGSPTTPGASDLVWSFLTDGRLAVVGPAAA